MPSSYVVNCPSCCGIVCNEDYPFPNIRFTFNGISICGCYNEAGTNQSYLWGDSGMNGFSGVLTPGVGGGYSPDGIITLGWYATYGVTIHITNPADPLIVSLLQHRFTPGAEVNCDDAIDLVPEDDATENFIDIAMRLYCMLADETHESDWLRAYETPDSLNAIRSATPSAAFFVNNGEVNQEWDGVSDPILTLNNQELVCNVDALTGGKAEGTGGTLTFSKEPFGI